MNMNELATAARSNVPIIEVVVDNHVLGMVRQWQGLFYGKRYSNTTLNDTVDYVKLSEALGVPARRVTTREEFRDAFKEALESTTPFFIDAVIDSDDCVWPMVAPGKSIETAFNKQDLERMEAEKKDKE